MLASKLYDFWFTLMSTNVSCNSVK